MVTFVSNPIANGVFRAMFYSTASRHNRRPVNPFVPNIKMIAEFAYLGKFILLIIILSIYFNLISIYHFTGIKPTI
jgi:hypothetical protein